MNLDNVGANGMAGDHGNPMNTNAAVHDDDDIDWAQVTPGNAKCSTLTMRAAAEEELAAFTMDELRSMAYVYVHEQAVDGIGSVRQKAQLIATLRAWQYADRVLVPRTAEQKKALFAVADRAYRVRGEMTAMQIAKRKFDLAFAKQGSMNVSKDIAGENSNQSANASSSSSALSQFVNSLLPQNANANLHSNVNPSMNVSLPFSASQQQQLNLSSASSIDQKGSMNVTLPSFSSSSVCSTQNLYPATQQVEWHFNDITLRPLKDKLVEAMLVGKYEPTYKYYRGHLNTLNADDGLNTEKELRLLVSADGSLKRQKTDEIGKIETMEQLRHAHNNGILKVLSDIKDNHRIMEYTKLLVNTETFATGFGVRVAIAYYEQVRLKFPGVQQNVGIMDMTLLNMLQVSIRQIDNRPSGKTNASNYPDGKANSGNNPCSYFNGKKGCRYGKPGQKPCLTGRHVCSRCESRDHGAAACPRRPKVSVKAKDEKDKTEQG